MISIDTGNTITPIIEESSDNNQILKDIYGADALLPTTAEMHIGNFGQYLDLLPGIEKATRGSNEAQ